MHFMTFSKLTAPRHLVRCDHAAVVPVDQAAFGERAVGRALRSVVEIAKLAAIPAAFAIGMLASREARAEVSILKTADGWDLYTTGRVDAFFSYGRGDVIPLARPGETIPDGGGLPTGSDSIPKIDPATGMPSTTAQGTFESMRVRSGFVPNMLGVGLRRKINDDWSVKAFINIWATIEEESQRKANPVFADVREGYVKIESSKYGTLTAGKALELFSRGAVENDFLYHDGYGLGFPGNIDTAGPTNGMIGFGVLAAFFSAGFMYATPSLLGLQLSVGVYDPTTLPGQYDSTQGARPEAELTYDLAAGIVKAHLFGNYAYQSFYKPGVLTSAKAYGIGYGGRVEVGPVHLGFAGHWGRGLGLEYAFQPGDVAVTQDGQLRFFDGYSVFGQVVAGPFDFNAGWGLSRALALPQDMGTNVSLPSQYAISGGIVYHATDYLHFDVDYLHGRVDWSLGEHQNIDFLNAGIIVTW